MVVLAIVEAALLWLFTGVLVPPFGALVYMLMRGYRETSVHGREILRVTELIALRFPVLRLLILAVAAVLALTIPGLNRVVWVTPTLP